MDLKWGILILIVIVYVKENHALSDEDKSPLLLKLLTLGIDSDSSSRLRRVAGSNCGGSSNSEVDGGDSSNTGCAFGNWGYRKRSVRDKRLGWGNRAMDGRKRGIDDHYIVLARLLNLNDISTYRRR